MMTIYDYPEYYDIAFSFRDYKREAEFLDFCIQQFSLIKTIKILEIGCGHAPHAEELNKLGYQYSGIDINKQILEFARQKSNTLKYSNSFFEKNMVFFEFEEMFDFIFVMLGSLFITSEAQMKSHFDSISKCLNRGGLYFLDYCVQFENPLKYKNNNEYIIEKDGIKIRSRFDISQLSESDNLFEETWNIDVIDNGNFHAFEMIEKNIALYPEDFKQFITNRNDFELVGWFSEWDLERPIHEKSEIIRPIVILRRI